MIKSFAIPYPRCAGVSGFYLDSIAFDSTVMRIMRRAGAEGAGLFAGVGALFTGTAADSSGASSSSGTPEHGTVAERLTTYGKGLMMSQWNRLTHPRDVVD